MHNHNSLLISFSLCLIFALMLRLSVGVLLSRLPGLDKDHGFGQKAPKANVSHVHLAFNLFYLFPVTWSVSGNNGHYDVAGATQRKHIILQ